MDNVLSIFRRLAVVIIWSAMAVYGTAQANDDWTPKQKAEFALRMQAAAAQGMRQIELCGWLEKWAWENVEYAKSLDDKEKYTESQRVLNDAASVSVIITALCQKK